MDKLNLHSKDILSANVDKIGEIFPGVITEAKDENGATKKAIDFDLLRQHLSDQLVDGDRERFRLDWPGKRASILKANTPTTKTLRPVRADSEEFDTTQNVFIEGDNFEVLKVLQESYLGKVKMIYIDPPYNTGKDFIYKDNFAADKGEYEEELGVRDDENGGKLVKNTETNGRYHSDWLSMMQERLIVARDLLTDDGVIFISIDDNEQSNLKALCDDVFGESNFIATFLWQKNYSPKNNNKFVSDDHDFIIAFAKNKEALNTLNRLPRNEKSDSFYSRDDSDGKGPYGLDNLTVPGGRQQYKLQWKGIEYSAAATRGWAYSENRMKQLIEEGRIYFPKTEGSRPRYKRYLSEVPGLISKTILPYDLVGHTDGSKKALDLLVGNNIFDFPKPIELIKYFSILGSNKNSIILDFFSGSGTTAHAIMQLNAEDGGNRKHIQVQLAEPTDPSSEAHKAGYKTIPEISRERIRRAAAKIREDYAEQIAKRDTPLDTGFRAYKLSSSNFTDTRLHPSQTTQASLLEVTDTVKQDRSAEDILTEVILDLGLTLDLPIEQKDIAGHTVYFVGGNALVACFDDTVSVDIVDEIAKESPLRVVFKDSSFANDEARINVDVRMKQLSPDTEVKAL